MASVVRRRTRTTRGEQWRGCEEDQGRAMERAQEWRWRGLMSRARARREEWKKAPLLTKHREIIKVFGVGLSLISRYNLLISIKKRSEVASDNAAHPTVHTYCSYLTLVGLVSRSVSIDRVNVKCVGPWFD